MDEEILETAKSICACGAEDEALLKRLCAASAQALERELREGVAPEDCEGAFICASAWLAAAALTGHTVDRAELVRIATEVEGHPDNVAPAILGGAVCSFTPTDSLPQCLRYEVSDRLRFITVIPPYEVHTSEARKVVPQEIPLSTAVWQMGRIAGMTRGLETGDLDLIAAANDDRIQEPYRRRLIPDYNAVRDTCLNGGAKTIWISGSGSTLMAVTDDTIVAKFLQVKLREQFPKCDTYILTCDTEGAQIEYL